MCFRNRTVPREAITKKQPSKNRKTAMYSHEPQKATLNTDGMPDFDRCKLYNIRRVPDDVLVVVCHQSYVVVKSISSRRKRAEYLPPFALDRINHGAVVCRYHSNQ